MLMDMYMIPSALWVDPADLVPFFKNSEKLHEYKPTEAVSLQIDSFIVYFCINASILVMLLIRGGF